MSLGTSLNKFVCFSLAIGTLAVSLSRMGRAVFPPYTEPIPQIVPTLTTHPSRPQLLRHDVSPCQSALSGRAEVSLPNLQLCRVCRGGLLLHHSSCAQPKFPLRSPKIGNIFNFTRNRGDSLFCPGQVHDLMNPAQVQCQL